MKYKFEDIAINSTAKKLPEPSDNEHYIGLEHLDSGNLYVTRWGADTAPIGEKLLMKKGDVLFGKRRAYQKKVGIAPFDGIFSAHGMVLRPKEDVICKEFFPFFISSDYFLNEAIRISVGGLSPTINWKDLRVLEFELPSLEEQRVLADKLWAAYEVKESYKNLLAQTDKLLHAQFEKMFGEVENRPLHEACDIVMGSSPDSSTYNNERNGLPFYQGKTEFGEMYVENPTIYCSQPIREAKQNDILMSVRAPVGAVNFAIDHCCIGRGLCSIRAKEDTTEQLFVFYALKIQENEIERLGTGSTIKCINKEQVYKIPIPKCDKNTQHEFVRIAEQAERTKASLNKGIEAIEAVIRSLIAEGTTKV